VARPLLTFLGGVREIGGNKLLIEDGPDRVLFDFGPSFSPRYDEFFVNYLAPRMSVSPVKDLLEFGLIPRVPGLFSREALTHSDLPHQAPEVHAVFVSHAHIDHAGYLPLIDPEIPVHVNEGTRALLEAIEGSRGTKYGDHPWKILVDRKPVKVGNLEIVPHPVDHSIPWASGFVIHTREGSIAYTGDYRAHGPRQKLTHEFVAAAGEADPSALVIEGTRAGPDPRKNLSEEGVRVGVDEILASADGVALVSYYPRDVDRILTMYEAARAAGRSFVVSLKTAHLLTKIHGLWPGGHLPLPGTTSDLLVYRRPKLRFDNWEKPFLDSAIDSEYVRGHGRELLLSLDLVHFAELIDLRPPAGSPFIHSMSEPFSEDDLDDKVLHNWLDHFGLAFHQLHASGHCSETELRSTVNAVGSATVYPIHTEHPEAFAKFGATSRPPELSEPYPIGGARRRGGS
jgi:ribonuclease J